MKLAEQAVKAKQASAQVRVLDNAQKNQVLLEFADLLEADAAGILQANAEDMRAAKAGGMNAAMLDRLRLDETRIRQIAQGVRQVAALADPVHQILEERTLASGLRLKKISVPFGVIAVIYESRPNVAADCAALCFKAGSACLLKGGRESARSGRAIVRQMQTALEHAGITADAVHLADQPSHEEVQQLMCDRAHIDLLIPRGGSGLIRTVVDHARVPVIETGAGICHVYVDAGADLKMALAVAVNAKTSRPSVCNAMETLLVQESIAAEFIPMAVQAMQEKGVTIYGCSRSRELAPGILPVTADSYDTEYGCLAMSLKVVAGVDEAIAHINAHGTHHSDAIISRNENNVQKFMALVDSACVYHNASTRFTDGFEFGLGAEIGISTQKLHARGPMGLKELTSYAYQIEGEGQIR